ncbi:MAG: metallophosphoesterase [Lachnospiraceae bacterium]|nr:metallophosphoesterase [Lachnospiraceae bacterium]MBR5066921.1 metallophosphoesterase [Lachnospiraceae bacterium]
MAKTEDSKKSKKIINILRIIFWAVAGFLILLTVWFFVPVTESFDLIKEGDTNPVRCVLITDLHSCYYGKNQKSLIKKIDKENPDIIFLGGDIFDDKIDDDNALIFLEDISKKYKCFYVSGNHEYWSERCDEMKDKVRSLGITVLEGDCETITVNGKTIDVCGVDDPTRLYERQFKEQLDNAYAKTSEDHFKILLTHRPERTDLYIKYDYDLILSGHAHAGQIRIPFINIGIYAPNQGLFSKYVSGIYTLENGSRLIVSRGLARESTLAPRFFNHPEIVVIDF